MDGLIWLAVPVGLLLILLAGLDIFLTVLHTQAESPISNEVNRRFWGVLVAVGRRLPAPVCDEVLGWGAPLMIAGIIVLWSLLYVFGFALLYLPVIHNETFFAPPDAGFGWPMGDALYFSAISFLTIGYGDLLPVHPLNRLLAVLEGGLGLVTLTLAVTYLLSVFPLISRKVGLAETLNQEMGGRSDAVELARRYVPSGRYEALAQRLTGINDELIKLGQAHGLYPVLYYVRPREVHHSFVRVLVLIQGIVATLRYGLDPSRYDEIVNDPRLMTLEEGLLSTLHMLAASSHLAPEGSSAEDDDAARSSFRDLTAELVTVGLAAAPPPGALAARHARFRTATDHYIRAYARNSAYEVAAVYAQYSRWERDTALIGHADLEEDESAPSDAATFHHDSSRAAATSESVDVRAAARPVR